MAKLGVITDGISRDFEHALQVATDAGLDHAELQFLWEKEVGDLNDDEMAKAIELINKFGVRVSCISRHNFVGMSVGEVEVGDADHQKHMDSTKRCIDMAKALDCQLVRIMSFRKEMILFGYNGAEKWNANNTAWAKLKELLTPVVKLAADEDITLVVETGNNAMITSCVLGHKLIDELGSDHLKILWDPANSLYCNEDPYPRGYAALRGGYLGHIHIKDANLDIPLASVEQTELGKGQMAPYLEDIAQALNDDNYEGVVSLESVYHPGNGSFEDGFQASAEKFKALFG
ncbi:MAG: sugar phosphate isomerase/epimerase family protein [Aeoliella sp.]